MTRNQWLRRCAAAIAFCTVSPRRLRRRPAGQDPGARLLPHDARRFRDHRAVRRHGRAAGGQVAHQHHARQGEGRAGARVSQRAGGDFRQRLPGEYGLEADPDRHRRGGPVRPHARQPAGEPQGFRLPARAGGRDLHHAHAPGPRRRAHVRRQDRLPQCDGARRQARCRLLAQPGQPGRGAEGRQGFLPGRDGLAQSLYRRREVQALRRRYRTGSRHQGHGQPRAIPRATPPISSRARGRSWCCGAT